MVKRVKNIIINADDFGLSKGVCQGIVHLFELNAITSTSIMVASHSATKFLKEFCVYNLRKKAGVHLQLTSGIPISKPKNVKTLINNDGSFRDNRGNSNINLNEVYQEWKSQIELTAELLKESPTHLDSHHGVHRMDGVFEIYLQLSKEYNIPVRGSFLDNQTQKIIKANLNASVAIIRDWTGKNLNSIDLVEKCNSTYEVYPNENAMEVIVHPGYSDSYLERISSLNVQRENDFYVLKTMSMEEQWNKLKYRLISYSSLKNGFVRT